jgi:hypothetical protein
LRTAADAPPTPEWCDEPSVDGTFINPGGFGAVQVDPVRATVPVLLW